MSKFNAKTKEASVPSESLVLNYEGSEAFQQDPKLEFVSILLTSMVKDQFYRGADETIERVRDLMDHIDPKFVAKAAIFARDEFGMRSISHVVAAELAHRVKGELWTKDFFDKIVVRPDDMTEILAYYFHVHGKPVPNSVKKGFAQAFGRLDRHRLAKYRGEGKDVSLVDVVNIVHPIPTLENNEALKDLVEGTLRSENTWESRMSERGQDDKSKAEVWRGLFNEGRMPYFALLRNLRNIEQTGDDELIERAAQQLVSDDPGEHRILPFRFLTAYQNVSDSRLVSAVSEALDRAGANVPTLPGKTFIVVDHSGSMGGFYPGTNQYIGDTFASLVFRTNNCDVGVFGDTMGYVSSLNPKDSTLTLASVIGRVNHGHGTNFHSVFSEARDRYDRIVIFTDMQGWAGGGGYRYHSHPGEAFADYQQKFKAKPFIYSFDLAGYGTSQFPEDRVFELAGFSEKVFDIMKTVEQDKNALVNRIESVKL